MSAAVTTSRNATTVVAAADSVESRSVHDGAAWWVRRGHGSLVVGREAPNWFALADDPRAVCVKAGEQRSAYRIEVAGEPVFAKSFDDPRSALLGSIRRRLRITPAEREWRNTRRAEALGVPATTCLALGVDRPTGRSALVFQALVGATTLAEVCRAHAENVASTGSHPTLRELGDVVAVLLAESHERGFVHRDGHPHNFLIVPKTSGEVQAVFADLHGARFFPGPAPLRPTARSLAQLDHALRRSVTRAQRLRFLRTYRAHRPTLSVAEKGLLSSMTEAERSLSRSLARQRDRRILRDGKYFGSMILDKGWRATVVLQLARRHAFPERGVPDRSLHQWRAILDRNGAQPPGLRLERMAAVGVSSKLAWTIFGSPARKEFVRTHRLRHRDAAAELLLGFCEHRNEYGLVDEAIVIRSEALV